MSKGYVILSQGNYHHMADLLADSIQATQSSIKDVHIIKDLEGDIVSNRTRVYELSPFDETVVLDADMIFLTDVSHWWNYMNKFPLLITNTVKTYRGNIVNFSPYRKTFNSNKLNHCYSAFYYFKKNQDVEQFFKLLKIIVNNWDDWTLRFAPEDRQSWPSIDLAMAIAVKILDIYPFSPYSFPTFTHMKSGCQGWPRYNENWQTHLSLYISDGKLRLGDHIQSGILHYTVKEVAHELRRLF